MRKANARLSQMIYVEKYSNPKYNSLVHGGIHDPRTYNFAHKKHS